MDLLISYIDGNMDRNIWINAKSTTATEIQAEINLKKKVFWNLMLNWYILLGTRWFNQMHYLDDQTFAQMMTQTTKS